MRKIMTFSLVLCAVVAFGGCGTPIAQFPLPDSVENFSEQGSSDSINFRTKQGSEELVNFYRAAFTNQGLVERTLVTVANDGVTSTVFDGHTSGNAIVIQTVELPSGLVNVNIRLEGI